MAIEKIKVRYCTRCDNRFLPDRLSRWLCEDCRYDWDEDYGDKMERNMDEQMLINIGMGD